MNNKIIEVLNKKRRSILEELESNEKFIVVFTYYVKDVGSVYFAGVLYDYKNFKEENSQIERECLTIEYKNKPQGCQSFKSLRAYKKLELIEDIEKYFSNL